MKLLARLIALAALLAAGVALLQPRPPAPPAPPPVAETRPAPRPAPPGIGLPRLTLPRLPDALRPKLPPPPKLESRVERILIEKADRRMTVWQQDGPPRVFTIALGKSPTGTKMRQGDNRTPEGRFKVDRVNRQSAYHAGS